MGFSGLLPIVRTLKLIGIACEHPHVSVLSAGSATAIRDMPGAGNMRKY